MDKIFLLASILVFFSHTTFGQIIINPSFEDRPQESEPPDPWFGCNQYSTPDTQPGSWGIQTKASDGQTFVSIVTRGSTGLINDNTAEAIGAKLNNLQNNVCYSVSMDLAFSMEAIFYGDQTIRYDDPLELKVWVSEEECQKSTLLWTSPIIDHTDWRTYSFNLSGNYNYIIMEATYPGDKRDYGNILLDNIRIAETSLDIGADTMLCRGTSLELSVNDFWENVTWSNGSNQRSIEVREPAIYWVEVQNDNCLLKDLIMVEYLPPLEIELGEDVSLCLEDSLILDVSVPNGTYLWNNGSNESQILITNPGTYQVEINNGCESLTDELIVTQRDKCCEVYAPNVFTPNGDGINDLFEITTESNISRYQIHIYNKWGRLVYSSNTINDFWDGLIADKRKALAGVYYWNIKIMCIENNDIIDGEFKGHVTILK